MLFSTHHGAAATPASPGPPGRLPFVAVVTQPLRQAHRCRRPPAALVPCRSAQARPQVGPAGGGRAPLRRAGRYADEHAPLLRGVHAVVDDLRVLQVRRAVKHLLRVARALTRAPALHKCHRRARARPRPAATPARRARRLLAPAAGGRPHAPLRAPAQLARKPRPRQAAALGRACASTAACGVRRAAPRGMSNRGAAASGAHRAGARSCPSGTRSSR